MSDRMAGILDLIAQALTPSSGPMPMVRPKPGEAVDVDLSALTVVPDTATNLVNDLARYGKQAVTGDIARERLLNTPELTGDAASITDSVGDVVSAAMNYGGLLDGPTFADGVRVASELYSSAKPGLVDAIGEANVNRAEGAGLLASMVLPSKVRNAVGDAGFYSQAVRASEGLQRKTGNANGFFNDLTGKGQVKPDELNAMGFKEHFAGRNDVSRAEVQQFIRDNQLQITETTLGRLDDKPYGLYDNDDMLVEAFATRAEADAALAAVPQEVFDRGEYYRSGLTGGGDTSKFGEYTLPGGDNYRELLLQDGSRIAGREKLRADIKDADDRIGELQVFHQLDPSKDYADELQQAVNDRAGILAQLDNYPNQFVQYNHFEQPDVLAHLRMKDRVDADGNKTLLIEEAQSDWHQTGGDRGYVTKSEYADLVAEERKLNEILSNTDFEASTSWAAKNAPDLDSALEKARSDFAMAREKARGNPGVDHTESIETARDNLRSAKLKLDDAFQADYLKQNGVRASDAYEQAQSEMQILRAELDPMHDAVPDAPFKTDDKSSWYNLAMKRGLIEAAEGDYDKLAITTGRQQAERYDLSKQIDEVRLGGNERDGFTVSAFDKNDYPVIIESIDSLDELPNLIGKDAAKSLVDQPLSKGSGLNTVDERRFKYLMAENEAGRAFGSQIEELNILKREMELAEKPEFRVLSGQDLSVGGEGMEEFYDRKLPNTLNKLVKQDGVKVGQTTLNHPGVNLEGFNMYEASEIQRLQDLVDRGRASEIDREYLANYLARAKPSGDTVHSIDITPEMRDRVKKGLPLFAVVGGLGLTEMMSQQQQQEPSIGLFSSLQY